MPLLLLLFGMSLFSSCSGDVWNNQELHLNGSGMTCSTLSYYSMSRAVHGSTGSFARLMKFSGASKRLAFQHHKAKRVFESKKFES